MKPAITTALATIARIDAHNRRARVQNRARFNALARGLRLVRKVLRML